MAVFPSIELALDIDFSFFSIIGLVVGKLHFVQYHGLLQVLFHLQGVYSVALGRTILVSGGEDSKVKKYHVNFSQGFFFSIKFNLFINQFFSVMNISRSLEQQAKRF